MYMYTYILSKYAIESTIESDGHCKDLGSFEL